MQKIKQKKMSSNISRGTMTIGKQGTARRRGWGPTTSPPLFCELPFLLFYSIEKNNFDSIRDFCRHSPEPSLDEDNVTGAIGAS
jgi:hypothetical protein